jgi:hypothetical protein
MIPALAYNSIILYYDETRKVFLRRGITRVIKENESKVKFTGWITRNTFY